MRSVKSGHKARPASPRSLPGVSEALVATAAGLFAAIPAVMAYNYFLSRIRKMAFRVEAFTIEFLNTLEESEKALEVEDVVQ